MCWLFESQSLAVACGACSAIPVASDSKRTQLKVTIMALLGEQFMVLRFELESGGKYGDSTTVYKT